MCWRTERQIEECPGRKIIKGQLDEFLCLKSQEQKIITGKYSLSEEKKMVKNKNIRDGMSLKCHTGKGALGN